MARPSYQGVAGTRSRRRPTGAGSALFHKTRSDAWACGHLGGTSLDDLKGPHHSRFQVPTVQGLCPRLPAKPGKVCKIRGILICWAQQWVGASREKPSLVGKVPLKAPEVRLLAWGNSE